MVEFALVLPLMVILLVAILDLARIYTTMMSVESAAREAADFGTTLGAGKWQAGLPMDGTVAEMQRRACVAASNLPDYEDPDGDPATGCTNPSFAYCVTTSIGGTCTYPVDPRLRPATTRFERHRARSPSPSRTTSTCWPRSASTSSGSGSGCRRR